MSFVKDLVVMFFNDILLWVAVAIGGYYTVKHFSQKNVTAGFLCAAATIIGIIICVDPEIFLRLAEQVRSFINI